PTPSLPGRSPSIAVGRTLTPVALGAGRLERDEVGQRRLRRVRAGGWVHEGEARRAAPGAAGRNGAGRAAPEAPEGLVHALILPGPPRCYAIRGLRTRLRGYDARTSFPRSGV